MNKIHKILLPTILIVAAVLVIADPFQSNLPGCHDYGILNPFGVCPPEVCAAVVCSVGQKLTLYYMLVYLFLLACGTYLIWIIMQILKKRKESIARDK
jgi:hypothetical protein